MPIRYFLLYLAFFGNVLRVQLAESQFSPALRQTAKVPSLRIPEQHYAQDLAQRADS